MLNRFKTAPGQFGAAAKFAFDYVVSLCRPKKINPQEKNPVDTVHQASFVTPLVTVPRNPAGSPPTSNESKKLSSYLLEPTAVDPKAQIPQVVPVNPAAQRLETSTLPGSQSSAESKTAPKKDSKKIQQSNAELAKEYFANGNYDEGFKASLTAITTNDKDDESRKIFVECVIKTKKSQFFPRAQTEIENLIKKNDSNIELYFIATHLYFLAGDLATAHARFMTFCFFDLNISSPTHEGSKKDKSRKKAFALLIEMEKSNNVQEIKDVPKNTPIPELIKKAEKHLNKHKLDLAKQCFTQAIIQSSENDRWYYERGLIEFKQGNYESALLNFTIAIWVQYVGPQDKIPIAYIEKRRETFIRLKQCEQSEVDQINIQKILNQHHSSPLETTFVSPIRRLKYNLEYITSLIDQATRLVEAKDSEQRTSCLKLAEKYLKISFEYYEQIKQLQENPRSAFVVAGAQNKNKNKPIKQSEEKQFKHDFFLTCKNLLALDPKNYFAKNKVAELEKELKKLTNDAPIESAPKRSKHEAIQAKKLDKKAKQSEKQKKQDEISQRHYLELKKPSPAEIKKAEEEKAKKKQKLQAKKQRQAAEKKLEEQRKIDAARIKQETETAEALAKHQREENERILKEEAERARQQAEQARLEREATRLAEERAILDREAARIAEEKANLAREAARLAKEKESKLELLAEKVLTKALHTAKIEIAEENMISAAIEQAAEAQASNLLDETIRMVTAYHTVQADEEKYATDELIELRDFEVKLFEALEKQLIQVRLVGSSVRGRISSGKIDPTKDVDIVVTANKQQILGLQSLGFYFSPSPDQEGLFQCDYQGTKIDIWENEAYKKSMKDDCNNRDFRINALYARYIGNGKARVYDPTGNGLIDLNNKIIDTITEPMTTFKDDQLRALRAVGLTLLPGYRLADRLKLALQRWNFHLRDEKTSKNNPGRFNAWFLKTLMSQDADKYVLAFINYNITDKLFRSLALGIKNNQDWIVKQLRQLRELDRKSRKHHPLSEIYLNFFVCKCVENQLNLHDGLRLIFKNPLLKKQFAHTSLDEFASLFNRIYYQWKKDNLNQNNNQKISPEAKQSLTSDSAMQVFIHTKLTYAHFDYGITALSETPLTINITLESFYNKYIETNTQTLNPQSDPRLFRQNLSLHGNKTRNSKLNAHATPFSLNPNGGQ